MKQKQFTNKEFQALVIRMLIELGKINGKHSENFHTELKKI